MADSQRKTANLFDESTLQNGYYGGGDNDYSSFFPNDGYRGFQMNLNAGTYTLNITCDVSIRLLRVSNSIDGRISVSTDDQPYTFTLAENATIYVSLRNQTTTNNYPNLKVMLNSGSSPLPYEPYGWVSSIKIYDGTTWQSATVKEWDGSEWQ